ncbi:MAG: efflux transporter outer membrane subunit [Deltaproteobacteria bacterium]|nr:efflux transporter outer membrane subunit [Deltaproteobacteria bacterium]
MKFFTVLVCLCALCACSALRSKYSTPPVALPASWVGSALNATVDQAGPWWMAFDDPVLNALIDQALVRNNDLAAAAIRVRTARLQARLTGTNITPDVSVSGDTSASRDVESGVISREHGVSASLSYEIDLWGKLAAARDAAEWEAQATDEDRLNTRLTLIGTVAETYWKIAYLSERIAQAEASVATARQTLELVSVRHEAGAVSGLDMVQARQDLAAQEAVLPALVEERTQSRMAMSVLFDQPPQTAVPERGTLPRGALPEIAAGVPAELLSRRPDLRAAELRLRASLAEVDQARAEMYPQLTLTGSLGSSSLELRSVLDNPIATLGAGLVLPFVQWNTVRLNIKVGQSQYEEAVVNFRQTLLEALLDVEKALAARQRYEAERSWLEESLTQARLSEEMSAERYRAGAISLQDWLETRETRRAAEVDLAENRLNRLISVMDIYLALGGDAAGVARR